GFGLLASGESARGQFAVGHHDADLDVFAWIIHQGCRHGFLLQGRIWPLPWTIQVVVVSSASPIGPRAWSFWVEMPSSAPRPSWLPSVKRVEALTISAAESSSVVNRCMEVTSWVQIASVWPEE